MGVCKNPAPIRLVFHDPPWAIFSFHSKNDKRKKNDNVLSRLLKSNVFCLSVVLQLFSVFGFFISLFVVIIAHQRMRVRFCTRKVPGRWSLHSFFDDWSHFQKTYTGFTKDNKTITKTITFGIKNGPYDTRPSSFPLLFPFPSFSFSFPFFLSFFFPFSFPIRSYFFSFRFLSFSFPFPFPLPFLFFLFPLLFLFLLPSSLIWILWSRYEASAWKNNKREKNNGKKNFWKG